MPDANTKLLLHFNGEDEATSTYDSSPSEHTITFQGTAQLDTAWKWKGLSSLLLDGNSDDLTIPDHADWDRGADDYTIDVRLRLNGKDKVQCIIGKNSAPTYYQLMFRVSAGNYLEGMVDDTAHNYYYSRANNLALDVDTDYHVAMVVNRSTNKIQLFVNGFETTYSEQDTIAGTAYTNNVPLIIGSLQENGASSPFDGHIDELRISKGIARWTSDFTPPTTEYQDVTVTPDDLTLQVTPQTPTIKHDCKITLITLALQATPQAPTIKHDCKITLITLTLEVTLQASTLDLSVTITPDALNLTLTDQVPTIKFPIQKALPNALVLETTLQVPTIVIDCVITPDNLVLTVTLQTSIISIVFSEIPDFMHKDLIDPYSGGAWLWLCQITVPTQTIQRIARNTEDVVYGENTFDKFNFDVSEQIFSSDGSIPQVTLRVFQDVNRRMENIINATEGALGADIKLIRVNEKFLSTPVTALEIDYENLASESDSEWVTFTLGLPNPLTQRYPLENYSSSICPEATPTLFKGPACQYAGADTSCTGTYEDCYKKGNAEFWGGELGLDASVVRV